MKRSRPHQHTRKLKSGKKIVVNKGVKAKKKRLRTIGSRGNFERDLDRYILSEPDYFDDEEEESANSKYLNSLSPDELEQYYDDQYRLAEEEYQQEMKIEAERKKQLEKELKKKAKKDAVEKRYRVLVNPGADDRDKFFIGARTEKQAREEAKRYGLNPDTVFKYEEDE